MKKQKGIIFRLLNLCIGSLLWSCASVSNVDVAMIQQKMLDYLKNETGKNFVLDNFEATIAYQLNSRKGYRGTFHQIGDERLVAELFVTELDDYNNLVEPEKALERFRLLARTVAITDRTTEITRAYFQPKTVHTHAWTSANNFKIKVYTQDKITIKNIKQYVAQMKKITKEINANISEIENNAFEVVLHVFAQDFKLPKYEAINGAIDFNGPTGDYTISTEINANGNVVQNSRIGFGSKLEREIKRKIFSRYNIDMDSHLHKDYHPQIDWYPEDLDKHGIRHFIRIMVPIKDPKTNKIIDRIYLKVNVFTLEMTTYQPKH